MSNEVVIKILNEELNISPNAVTRFTTGYCHSVYCVEVKKNKYVLRITARESEWAYRGSVKWLMELKKLEIPVPKILKHGQYGDMFYNLITFINGKDLGDVYDTLSDPQKRDITRELTAIQRKVATLSVGRHEYSQSNNKKWIKRSRERIKQNKIFDVDVCNEVEDIMLAYNDYFLNIQPVPFLNDISTKNVLIHDGRLAGIVDIDEMEYGDPFSVVGLTNMALLAMETDTRYVDYWLDEMGADEAQRKAVIIYTLLSCIDFMGEQGMRFSNDKIVPVNQKTTELLDSIYNKLIAALRSAL